MIMVRHTNWSHIKNNSQKNVKDRESKRKFWKLNKKGQKRLEIFKKIYNRTNVQPYVIIPADVDDAVYAKEAQV